MEVPGMRLPGLGLGPGLQRALLAAAALLPAAALAANDPPQLEPSAALQCLYRGPQPLLYPPDLLERKDGDTISVQLTFTRPDAEPSVVFPGDRYTLEGLRTAVREHVRAFRLPCLGASGATVVLRQVYVFTPNDGRKVVSSKLRDDAEAAMQQQFGCLKHVDGGLDTEYPSHARRDEEQGNVLVRLTFTRPDQPPTTEVLASPKGRWLRGHAERQVAGLRLPCLQGAPAKGTLLFKFSLDGGNRTVLRDMGLLRLIGAAKDLPRGVYFDLHSMGCPFDLRLTYMRPHQTNTVRQLETGNPARQPLLDWLEDISLNVDERLNTALLGQTMTVSVPCVIIDL